MPIELRAELHPFEKWQTYNDGINLFEGIFSGLLIVIAIISLFLYGYTRYSVFVYFSAYCVSNLIYFLHTYGILEIWFFPNNADPLPFLWLLPLLSGGLYFSFAREFLELKEFRAKIDPWLGYASKAMIALFVLSSLYLVWSGSIFLPMQIMGIGLIVAAAFILIVLILINKQGTLITKYFSYGTIFLILSVVVAVVLTLTKYSNEIPIYVQLGIMVETLIFSLGISHKLKRDFENHEITQKSLILQLQNNDKLYKKANEDLTELVAARTQQIKKKNKQLEKARNEAEKATLAKSEFLSVMSHEIRTPLNAIISLSHIMEMDNDSEEMQEYIDALKFSAEGLHSLINDVLDYNKIEADKLKFESIDFSIIDLLSNIRDSFKYKAKSQNIELLVEIGEHMPDRIIGDPTRLTQIYNKLIGNALKFTQDGQVHLKALLLGLKDEKVSINFEVNDTGIGIPKEKLETIFEAYEQAGRETAREYGGTGLGLSITQKLLNLMGSEIKIESTEKEGTSLAFEIDFQIDRAFDLVNLQDQMRDKDLKNNKLLVVDDNEMNRLVLKRLLTNWNACIVQASNGKQAIALSREQQFDLILMD